MKTEEEIQLKIEKMKEDLSLYIEHFNNSIKLDVNGVPNMIDNDIIYNISKSQIEALEWVLKDSRRK